MHFKNTTIYAGHINCLFFYCNSRAGTGLQGDWKMALDRNEHVAAILMNLSKDFDCLPHNLTVQKLGAYGLS
jgi:hypothetical protein